MSPSDNLAGRIKDPFQDREDRPATPYKRFARWIKNRYPWLPWVCAAGVVVIGVTVLFLWMTDFFKTPGEQYTERCRKYLLGVEGQEGEITQAEKDRLDSLARQLRLQQKEVDKLCLEVKRAIYLEREKAYQAKDGSKGEISSEDRKALSELASRMGIEEILQESQNPIVRVGTSPPKDTKAKVTKLLENGRYPEAVDLAAKWPNDLDMSSVVEGVRTALDVKVSFQFQRPGQPPSPILPVSAEEMKGITLTHNDNYRIFFETGEESYLYIFQIDELGKAVRLFPNPQSLDAANPIQPLMRYSIPHGEKEWLYLEEIVAPRESLRETFYVIAARWEAKDLDEAYAEVHRAGEREEWEKALIHLKDRIQSRKEIRKPGVFFEEFEAEHRR